MEAAGIRKNIDIISLASYNLKESCRQLVNGDWLPFWTFAHEGFWAGVVPLQAQRGAMIHRPLAFCPAIARYRQVTHRL